MIRLTLPILIAIAFCWLSPTPLAAYPRTDAQQQRLEKLIPKTYAKLERREPVHVAIIGDGVSRMKGPSNTESILHSMHGIFLHGIEGEFFYTGGVRVINPLGQNPQKLNEHIGPEITVEHFTEAEAIGLNALQYLEGGVFLNEPSLVIIHLGLNDAFTGSLIETYREALKRSLQMCLENEAEVILVGPTLLNDDPATVGWGLTRRYAGVMRRLAEEFGVMYLDPGKALAMAAAVPLKGEARARSLSVSQSLEMELFNHGASVEENRYINAEAHKDAGHAMFEQFLNGIPAPTYDLYATAVYAQPNDLRVTLHMTNKALDPRQGVIGVLNIGQSWEPENAYLPFKLGSGKRGSYEVTYRRRTKDDGGENEFYREEGNDMELVCAALVSDLDGSQLIETDAVLSPVSVQWNFKPLINQEDSFPVSFVISNPNPDPVSGTYQFTYAKQRATREFKLGALEAKEFSALCRLPKDGRIRSKDRVQLQIDTGKHRLVFDREVEVTQDMGLGTPWQLARADEYQLTDPAAVSDLSRQQVTMTGDADNDFLTLTFDVVNMPLERAERKASMIVEVGIDARPPQECQTFGFIHPVRIDFQAGQEEGKTDSMTVGAFGNGYDKIIDSRGIHSQITSDRTGKNHKVIVKVPRIYMYEHPWRIGSADGFLGISAKLKFLRIDTGSGKFSFPEKATWVTNSPALHPYDPAGLMTLEMNSRPSGWSVRLY